MAPRGRNGLVACPARGTAVTAEPWYLVYERDVLGVNPKRHPVPSLIAPEVHHPIIMAPPAEPFLRTAPRALVRDILEALAWRWKR